MFKLNYRQESHNNSLIQTGLFVLVSICIALCTMPVAVFAENTEAIVVYQHNKTISRTIAENLENKFKNSSLTLKLRTYTSVSELSLNSIPSSTLIVTIGASVTEYILGKDISNPVLSLLIPKHAYKALKEAKKTTGPWIVSYIDHPVFRQLSLIKHLLGKNKTVGSILGPVSVKDRDKLVASAKKNRQKLLVETIDSDDNLIASLKLLTNQIDVLLALPDPVAFNRKTVRGILLLTYRNNIPVIGFSQSYVKAGAVAALYSDPEQITNQAYLLIDEFLRTGDLDNYQYYPYDFHIAVNEQVARSMGINYDNIERLIQRIKNDEFNQ